MSRSTSVRSLGLPYFGFVMPQGIVTGALYTYGFIGLTLEFRVNALPPMRALASEKNPLFGVYGVGASVLGQAIRETLLALSVTPDGALVGSGKNGAEATTGTGRLAPGTWYSASLFYDTGTGDLVLVLNSIETYADADGGGALTPTQFAATKAMLFNGPLAESRTDVSARHATAYATDGQARTITWAMNDRGQGALFGHRASGEYASVASVDLSAAWVDPGPGNRLYGDVPLGDPGAAYRWEVRTEYARVSRPRTVYTKVVA